MHEARTIAVLGGNGVYARHLIHIADMAIATVAAVAGGSGARGVLIISDDRPAPWREIFEHVAHCAGTDAPAAGGRLGFPSSSGDRGDVEPTS